MRFPIGVNASDQLRIDIHLHTFFLGDRQRRCWTYITQGLVKHGQQELALSLLLEDGDSADAFPKTPIKIFQLIENYAADGKIVKAMDATRLGKTGLFGFTALYYLPSIQFDGLTDLTNHLAMMLVHQPEYEFARRYGFTRLLSRIGKYCSSFPYPTWNTRLRPTLYPAHYAETTVLESFKDQHPITAQAAITRLHLHISVNLSDSKKFTEQLDQLMQTGKPMLLRTGLTQNVNASLYWEPGQTVSGAYTAPDQATIFGLSFVIFRRAILSTAHQTEDGITVYLSAGAGQALRDTRLQGKETVTQDIDPLSFSIAWNDDIDPASHKLSQTAAPRAYEHQAGWAEIELPQQKIRLASVVTRDQTQVAGKEIALSHCMRLIQDFLRSSMEEESASFTLTICMETDDGQASFQVSSDIDLNQAFCRFIEQGLLNLEGANNHSYADFVARFQVNVANLAE